MNFEDDNFDEPIDGTGYSLIKIVGIGYGEDKTRNILDMNMIDEEKKLVEDNTMELLNFKSNGCRFVYEGILAKYVNSGDHNIVIDNALIIKTKIKYELNKSIKNDSIECTHIIDLDQCYKDKAFKHNLLYSIIIDCMEIDKIHTYELICNLNDLLNKEYFNI